LLTSQSNAALRKAQASSVKAQLFSTPSHPVGAGLPAIGPKALR